jgi:hypothetical protein
MQNYEFRAITILFLKLEKYEKRCNVSEGTHACFVIGVGILVKDADFSQYKV